MSLAKHTDTQRNFAVSRTGGQTRRRARDEEDEKQQHPQPSAHVSPAMRIYRHALESVFAMLDLGDLCRVLAVSREWSAAVRSMKPTNASIQRDSRTWVYSKDAYRPLPPIASIVASPLLRHLAAIEISGAVATWTPLDNASLALLAHHAPNLMSMWCALTLTPNQPLIIPAQLRSLRLRIGGPYSDAVINGVLRTLAALPSLSRLHLQLSAFDDPTLVEMRILADCPSLTDLALEGVEVRAEPKLTHAQVDQIRSSLGHLSRFSAGRMQPNQLARFLQPPVTARWRDIGFVYADEPTAELLLRLPTLTKLDITYVRDTAHVDFLPQLSQLLSLTLECDKHVLGLRAWYLPADALLASLLRCTCLTELALACGFNSTHWSALLGKLSIKQLTIRGGDLDTLQCFATGPITQSLVELTIEFLKLPPSELPHLYGLRRLQTLRLDDCFSSRLDDALLDQLSPPAALLPALTELSHSRENADGQWVLIERRGASFEWMQSRLMQ